MKLPTINLSSTCAVFTITSINQRTFWWILNYLKINLRKLVFEIWQGHVEKEVNVNVLRTACLISFVSYFKISFNVDQHSYENKKNAWLKHCILNCTREHAMFKWNKSTMQFIRNFLRVIKTILSNHFAIITRK